MIINALTGTLAQPPQNVSVCDDTKAMLSALEGDGKIVDIGAAGTAMRFLTAYFALQPGRHVLTGSERMQHRPIGILVDALRSLGADIDYAKAEGFPPLTVTGCRLEGGTLSLPGNVSSQYLSALLMIAPLLDCGLTLCIEGEPVSVPYIDMTLSLMRHFGAVARWEDKCTLCVEPGPYKARPFVIENDWSAASYWYEMVALSPCSATEVHLPGLFSESVQGDSEVRTLFEPLGVATRFDSDGIVLSKCRTGNGLFVRDLKNQPDLAQTLVCTCLAQGRPFSFSGLGNLKIKETDRLNALCVEAAKLGYTLSEQADSVLAWDGRRSPSRPGAVISTYEDHRMAMAFAPLSLAMHSITIDNPGVVSKSYPSFWNDLQRVGFAIIQETEP